eukprot:6186565-Pleurochrysis_carterae.AAC.3
MQQPRLSYFAQIFNAVFAAALIGAPALQMRGRHTTPITPDDPIMTRHAEHFHMIPPTMDADATYTAQKTHDARQEGNA